MVSHSYHTASAVPEINEHITVVVEVVCQMPTYGYYTHVLNMFLHPKRTLSDDSFRAQMGWALTGDVWEDAMIKRCFCFSHSQGDNHNKTIS